MVVWDTLMPLAAFIARFEADDPSWSEAQAAELQTLRERYLQVAVQQRRLAIRLGREEGVVQAYNAVGSTLAVLHSELEVGRAANASPDVDTLKRKRHELFGFERAFQNEAGRLLAPQSVVGRRGQQRGDRTARSLNPYAEPPSLDRLQKGTSD